MKHGFQRDGRKAWIDGLPVNRVLYYKRGVAADASDYEITFLSPCPECKGDGIVGAGVRDIDCEHCETTGEVVVNEHCMSVSECASFEQWALSLADGDGFDREAAEAVQRGIAMAQTERAPRAEGEAA